MAKYLGCLVIVSITVAGFLGAKSAHAQDPLAAGVIGAMDDASRYATVVPREPSRSIAQQKAAFRAQQRLARQAALRWYGFSASRPTASGIPWTTMYSPAWAMPGGRPFGWYHSSRPVVIIGGAPATYR